MSFIDHAFKLFLISFIRDSADCLSYSWFMLLIRIQPEKIQWLYEFWGEIPRILEVQTLFLFCFLYSFNSCWVTGHHESVSETWTALVISLFAVIVNQLPVSSISIEGSLRVNWTCEGQTKVILCPKYADNSHHSICICMSACVFKGEIK